MFKIYDENMNLIPFPEGVLPIKISKSSIGKNVIKSSVEGRNGSINYGFTYSDYDMNGEFFLRARDLEDATLLRDELYALLDMGEFIYVVEDNQPGKRNKVQVVAKHTPTEVEDTGIFYESIIGMMTYDLPFAESIGTTQDIQNNGITSENGLWSFGMGLIDDDSLIYTHETTSFQIYNAGDVVVHPFEQELKIIISNVIGATQYLELENLTNGSLFRVNEPVTYGQTIVLDGPNITRNSLAFFRSTNRKFISLEPGWNDFIIRGASRAKTEFDFRFYYK